jgi:hypothetical protein
MDAAVVACLLLEQARVIFAVMVAMVGIVLVAAV